VGFVVDKVASGQVFSEYFGFPCQSSFYQSPSPVICGWYNKPVSGRSTKRLSLTPRIIIIIVRGKSRPSVKGLYQYCMSDLHKLSCRKPQFRIHFFSPVAKRPFPTSRADGGTFTFVALQMFPLMFAFSRAQQRSHG
jgi:hypothetical protein